MKRCYDARMIPFRIEHDSMGEVSVPHSAYFGAQTQRAAENFPVSGRSLPTELIAALGLLKWAAARANHNLHLFAIGPKPLSEAHVRALIQAAAEVSEGRFQDQFPVDVFQTGSGTSSNMNVNEVIANRAIELLGEDRFAAQKSIHPNDHVNLGQSTNDIFPSAIHVAATRSLRERLLPALRRCQDVLLQKAAAWQGILKIGRTHLADATPLTLGQEFSGFARQMKLACERAERAVAALLELPVGGTAVGTGINTHPQFAALVCNILAEKTDIPFREAENHFEANAQRDALAECHGQIRTIVLSLFEVANSIRFLGSGPRCGFHEISLPALQPGSSIMPGKVNPVQSESLMQVCAAVLGNDSTIAFAAAGGGQFQLNIMMPVMGEKLLESIRLLAAGVIAFTDFCLSGIEPDRAACEAGIEKSLSLVTGLVPLIGYDRAAALAKEAFSTGKTIRELCREQHILSEQELAHALDPERMIKPDR